jgi:hypothetical protein
MKPYAVMLFVLMGCHDGAASTVTLATPQTSATSQPSSSGTLSSQANPEATTKKRAALLVAAFHFWRVKHPDECPTAMSLVREGAIAAELAVDAWTRPFKIECDDDLTTVSSFGADGKEGTADDIRASL